VEKLPIRNACKESIAVTAPLVTFDAETLDPLNEVIRSLETLQSGIKQRHDTLQPINHNILEVCFRAQDQF
jgi:hypothetical protein